jgi:type IX secretion system substrate protein
LYNKLKIQNNEIIMKKILLLATVMLATITFANAQDFSLSWDGTMLGDTASSDSLDAGAHELVFEAIFHNNTSSRVSIKVIRKNIYILEGDTNYFCWGACWPASMDTSAVSMEIDAGGSSGVFDFSAHYKYNGSHFGISQVEYTFYNVDNPDENVKVITKYEIEPDGINETILENVSISNLYPNPALDFVTLDYDLPAEVDAANIKIVNVLGSVVKEQRLETGTNKVRLDLSNLNNGIYFYSIFLNEEIFSTKKLIVR